MLHLWLTNDRKQNTKQAFSLIRAGYTAGKEEQILLVPEQFSHMMQEQFCRAEGDKASLMAKILDFTRLAEEVFSVEGGLTDTQTNEAGRLLIMSLAVEQVRSRLKIFANAADKPEFLLQLLSMLDEFRNFCVTPDSLRLATDRLEGVLGQKIEEFALLMESYSAVCETCGQNPQSLLNRLLETLSESNYPAGKTFYLDGFTDFTGVQLEIIGELLWKAEQVHIFLPCPALDVWGQQFRTAADTGRQLLRLCAGRGVSYELHSLLREDGNAFDYLRDRLFAGRPEPHAADDAVCFIHAGDTLSQCRILAGEILRLTVEGVRYRDISIACCDFTADRPVLESVLRRAEIPAYYAGDTDILKQPLLHMLLSALEAAGGAMEQEDVLAYIKSPFSPLPRERSDRLENYILLWDLSGRAFREPWQYHPGGLQEELLPADQELLDALEADRLLAIGPLLRLRDALRAAANTGDMVKSLYAFMGEIHIRERLEELARGYYSGGELQKAQEYVQLYEILRELLEQIYGVLGGSVRSNEEFYSIFRTAISRSKVGTIPAALDCVNVGDLASQRRCHCDYLFVLGANEGYFPGGTELRGLLTDRERKSLMELGIGVSPTADGRLERELAVIDSVVSGAGERIWFTASEGKESYFFRRLRKLFPLGAELRDDRELVMRSVRDHLEYIASRGIQTDAPEELCCELDRLLKAGEYRPENLNSEEVRALYGNTLRLSSSKIDALASCSMYYFLNYGLKARERKSVQVDPSVYGTFVHYVLEMTAKTVMAEGGFAAVDVERTLSIAREHMLKYTHSELKDLWKSQRAEYLFRRNFSEVEEVVRDLHRELSKSSFEPRWFELHFAEKDGDLPAVRIVGEKMTATLEGFVDRSDVFRSGNRLYVRVVDYKTGKKSFEYTKICNGLGLQMLIYLFALVKAGETIAGEPLYPAGVLYFPARMESVSLKNREELATAIQKRSNGQRRSGLLLDEQRVLDAMEPVEEGENPCYLPYKFDKEGIRKGDLAGAGQLELLSHFVFRKVAELGDKLFSGEIGADPYLSDGIGPCAWCCYESICREHKQIRQLEKIKTPEEFWTVIGEVAENG